MLGSQYQGVSLFKKAGPARSGLRLLAFVIIFIIVFHRFFNHCIIYRDSFQYVTPYKFLIAQAWRGLQIYRWFPWRFLGLPFVSDIQMGCFYPLNLLYVFLPLWMAHNIFILVHYPLAAFFMDLFLRGRSIDGRAAFIAGLAFAMSGYLISMHSEVTMLIGACWAPLFFYCIDQALHKKSICRAGCAAAAMSMQILGGDPQSAYISAVIVLLWCLYAVINKSRRSMALAVLSLTGILALLLCLCQILPTAEIMRFSIRKAGFNINEATVFFFHPGRLIELLWPTPFTTVYPFFKYWGAFALETKLNQMPLAVTDYLGLSVLLLAGVGLWRGRGGQRVWLGIGILIFLALAMGHYTAVFRFFYHYMPFFKIFRAPEKYMAWFTGFTVVAAALGLEKTFQSLSSRNSAAARWSLIYISGVIVSVLIAFLLWPAVLRLALDLKPATEDYKYAISELTAGGLQWLAINLLAGLLLWVAAKRYLSPGTAEIIFGVLLITDYYSINVKNMPLGPKDIYSFRSAPLQVIRKDEGFQPGEFRIFRGEMKFSSYNLGSTYTYIEQDFIWRHYSLAPEFDVMAGLENAGGNVQGMLTIMEGVELFLKNDPKPFLLPLYNVKYLIHPLGDKYAEDLRGNVILSDPRNALAVAKMQTVFPRSFIVPAAARVTTYEKAVVSFIRADPTTTVILTTDDAIDERASGQGGLRPARIVHYEPDRVAVEAESETPGWLVLSDRYFPGWRAFAQGQELRIYKANAFVRAVRIPAGKTRVEFIFQPFSLRIGGEVSLIAWSALFLILLRGQSLSFKFIYPPR